MYDYIIVGAGAAGCVLANRLSADLKTTILLLEAGGSDKKQEIHIPAAFSKLFKTPYDWAYFTQSEPGLLNRSLYWPRGKVLGGSTSINAMIYMRGNRYDYDSWQAAGNEGWSYADVLPYFKKAENQERGPDEYHGVGGPLNVSDPRYTNPLSHAFVEACKESGIPGNPDFNGPTQEGTGLYQVTQKNGTRWSTVNAYLKPALPRSNLRVLTASQVTRIEIEHGRAIGVTYVRNGKSELVRANREVLICGGAINSPQLLLLSGIGPAADLRALDLPVIVDLPGVGQNLQDHLASGVVYRSRQAVSLSDIEKPSNLLPFLLKRKGPLTSNIAESGAFIKIQPDAQTPDIQFHFAPIVFLNHGLDPDPGHGFTIGPTLLHPTSRGRITLHSSNPLVHPLIEANYFQSSEDASIMLKAVKLSQELAMTSAFAPFRGDQLLGGPDLSDEETLHLIRQHAETLYHPVGTCKMGNDELAVVDAQLRVHGIKSLRVIDASIMPGVVSGNTNAPTIMIAEKAVDLLQQR